MSTNMTGFKWFSKFVAFLCASDLSSLSIGRVKHVSFLFTSVTIITTNKYMYMEGGPLVCCFSPNLYSLNLCHAHLISFSGIFNPFDPEVTFVQCTKKQKIMKIILSCWYSLESS